jgi:long-chain acyl-CoA synthetase
MTYRRFIASPISDTLTDLTTTFTAYPIPSPTILFLAPEQFTSLWTAISTQARRSLVSGIAYRHKLSALSEGFVTKDSLWDRLVFDSARASIMGEGAGTVRAIIVAGKGLLDKSMSEARATMSVPIVHASSHPAVPAPMTASHPFDFQTFSLGLSDGQSGMHAGAPSVNLEAKILEINDQAVEAGGDPEGALYVRGPAVGQVLGEEVDEETEYRWLNTEERVRVQTNGCFKFFL